MINPIHDAIKKSQIYSPGAIDHPKFFRLPLKKVWYRVEFVNIPQHNAIFEDREDAKFYVDNFYLMAEFTSAEEIFEGDILIARIYEVEVNYKRIEK